MKLVGYVALHEGEATSFVARSEVDTDLESKGWVACHVGEPNKAFLFGPIREYRPGMSPSDMYNRIG